VKKNFIKKDKNVTNVFACGKLTMPVSKTFISFRQQFDCRN